jgi:hypothetical protein
MSEAPGRYQRSFSGLVASLVVLLLVVFGFVGFRSLFRNNPSSPVHAVSYKQSASYAKQTAPFPVLAPRRLPPGWIATSVSYNEIGRKSWHMGMLTGQQHYVGLEQSRSPVSDMVSEFVDQHATQGKDVTVAGRRWQTWTDAGHDLALVRHDPKVTTLVVGPVALSTLRTFVATLH